MAKKGWDDVLELLAQIDEGSGRLATNRHTVAVTRQDLLQFAHRFAVETAERHGVRVTGGVFSGGDVDGKELDELWCLSMGEDVEVQGDCKTDGGVPALYEFVEEKGLFAFQSLVCPRDGRFEIVQTEDRGKTVFAKEFIPAHTEIGVYHGYIRHCTESSNEHYNASMLGVDFLETVDPTFANDDMVVEFHNCVPPRINEPPPDKKMNCRWVLRNRLPPLMATILDVHENEELFVYYGDAYDPIRTWKINPDCEYIDDDDNELS